MQHYDEVWKNEKPAEHYKSEFPQQVLTLLKSNKTRRILDIGAGDGTNLLFLSKRGFEAFGLELSGEGVKKAQNAAQHEDSKITIVQRDMFKPLPYDDEFFDAVYSYQALNHGTLKQILELFKEINRVLRVGGIFSVKTADIDSFKIKKISGKTYLDEETSQRYEEVDEQTYLPLDGEEKGLTHYMFSKGQLEKQISQLGFKLLNSSKTKWHILANFKKTGG